LECDNRVVAFPPPWWRGIKGEGMDAAGVLVIARSECFDTNDVAISEGLT
jgi:hypothetical protein